MHRDARVALAYVLFTLSGMAGLVFESVFLRQLAWLFGNSASATAVVLASFMAGLALGAAVFGGLADRSTRPLWLYGVLELAAAGSAALLSWLLGSGRQLFFAPLRSLETGSSSQRAAELLLAFALVLVPSVCMGGTLPALGRFVIRDMRRFVGSLGLLYGLNTLGASVGVFLAGFYLFEWTGISRSAYLAAALLALVGVVALLAGRRPRESESRPATPRGGATPPARAGRLLRASCVGAAAVGGLVVLGYEVAWTRLLSLFMRSFSYSFSLMLSLFLLGLCLGALLLGLLPRLHRKPAPALGWILVAMGVYVASTLVWLPRWIVPVEAASFGEFLTRAALRAALVVLPPTILSGMALPLAARGFAGAPDHVGADVGRVYAANTAGAILGALWTGLWLLPAAGAPSALALLAAINVLGGTLVLVAISRRQALVAAGLLAATLLAPLGRSERFVEAFLGASIGREQIDELLFFHEGATDTIAVVRKDYGFHDPQAKSLITNGVAMSATVKPVWRYMSAEGHLPVLLASRTDAALAVGVGTGITLAAVVSHPTVERIAAVELSEGVIRGLDHFEHENGRSHRDPRVDLVRADGRHYLELSDATWDVITLEPPPPIVAGSVHLYSLDFYRLCRRRLREGGTVAQWLPLHAQSEPSARMTARTFAEAFPHVTLWLPSIRDAVLVGSMQPFTVDLDHVHRAYSRPRTRANLQRAYLETPEALLGTLLLDRDGVERWAGDAPVITDERPLMEFFRHQGGNMNDGDIAPLLLPPQAGWDWVRGLAADPATLEAIRRENEALRAYVRSGVERDPGPATRAALLSRGTDFYLYRFGCAPEQLSAAAVPAAHRQRCALLRDRRDAASDGPLLD